MAIPKRSFIFVRHGQTDWNVERRIQGLTDTPLNGEGMRQAENICQKLLAEHVDVVISSPLIRALKTAAFIAETHQRPIHIESRLTERGFGTWEGELLVEILEKHGLGPDDSLNAITLSPAEPWPDVCGRIVAAVGDWLKKHPRKKMVFVGHSAVFRALMESLTGTSLRADNAQPYLFQPTKKGWEIIPL